MKSLVNGVHKDIMDAMIRDPEEVKDKRMEFIREWKELVAE